MEIFQSDNVHCDGYDMHDDVVIIWHGHFVIWNGQEAPVRWQKYLKHFLRAWLKLTTFYWFEEIWVNQAAILFHIWALYVSFLAEFANLGRKK